MGNQRRSQSVRLKHTFINTHRREFDTAVMCRLLGVSRSGFYNGDGTPSPIERWRISDYLA